MKTEEITNKQEWDNFVTGHPEANFLQSWQWGEFHRSRGRDVIRRGVYVDGELAGVYEGVVEVAKRGRHLAVAGGPIVDWSNLDVVRAIFEDMQTVARQKKCVFVRVRPQLEYSDKSNNIFRDFGFRKAPYYLSVEHAGVLDLTKSEEEILKGMRQRLRRALRKAEKNHIEISTSQNPDDIDNFYNIQLETAKRHSFTHFGKEFLRKQFEAFAVDDSAVIYTASFEGQILAQNFMIFYGNEASYHYGVSSELGTKMSGAPLLHMQAMRDARERGIERYNLWGIVGEDDTKHRFYGVSTFKRGFGVDEIRHLPAQDLIISSPKYMLNWSVETARRKIRKV